MSLPIVHWNDVYHVRPQKIPPNSSIDVTQFAALLDKTRNKWPARHDGTRDGLSLFSGDLFSPSADSTVTRGNHMVPVINELAPDVAVTGNHDFDFGYLKLSELIKGTNFPWLLSNIIDDKTNQVPQHLQPFLVLEKAHVRVGIIGLVEEDWITTISAWPTNFKFRDMTTTGRELSHTLRGEHHCDLIIALTHCRLPNDLQLAKELLALSPTAQKTYSIAKEHGVDMIIGGHDHFYFASTSMLPWEGYTPDTISGSEGDDGSILVIKSGTDFRELTELTLDLEDTPSGSIRKKVIKAVRGKRHEVEPDMPSSESLKKILASVLKSVSKSLNVPVCTTAVDLDVQSQSLRTHETASGNWFADVLKHAYDDALQRKYGTGADATLITGGVLRGDKVYPPGIITLGDILDILPWDDPVVVLELDGESLWNVFEQGLSKYPALDGRFPVISGLRVSWDSRRPPGQRVLGIWLQEAPESASESGSERAIKKEKNGRKYKLVTSEYLATGHDGYAALTGHPYLVDGEEGQIMSTLIKSYLLGAHYVNRLVRLRDEGQETNHFCLHSETADAIKQTIEHKNRAQESQQVASHALHQLRSRTHYVDCFTVSAREDMSCVDNYDGASTVWQLESQEDSGKKPDERDLLVIHPVIDGRLKDVARI